MFKNYGKTALLLAAMGGLTMDRRMFGSGWISGSRSACSWLRAYWFSDQLAIASARGRGH